MKKSIIVIASLIVAICLFQFVSTEMLHATEAPDVIVAVADNRSDDVTSLSDEEGTVEGWTEVDVPDEEASPDDEGVSPDDEEGPSDDDELPADEEEETLKSD